MIQTTLADYVRLSRHVYQPHLVNYERQEPPAVRAVPLGEGFIDLEAFFCILPDRKPVTGPLAGSCALTPHPSAPFFFRPANQAVDYVKGFNVLSIVIELPSSMLEHGAPGKLGIWGTISR